MKKAKRTTKLQSKVSNDVQMNINSYDKLERQLSTPFFKVLDDDYGSKEKSIKEMSIQKRENSTKKKESPKNKEGFMDLSENIETEKKIYNILFTPEKNKNIQSNQEDDFNSKFKISSSKNSNEHDQVSQFITFRKNKNEKTYKNMNKAHLKKKYESILEKIKVNKHFQMPKLYFDKNYQKEGFTSQLFLFKPNSKNGRHIRFDHKLKTCVPIFRCQGCLKEFKVPSALGGHLSKCPDKKIHEQVLNQMKGGFNLRQMPKNQGQQHISKQNEVPHQFKIQNYFDFHEEAENLIKRFIQEDVNLLQKNQQIQDNNDQSNQTQRKWKRRKIKNKRSIRHLLFKDEQPQKIQEQHE